MRIFLRYRHILLIVTILGVLALWLSWAFAAPSISNVSATPQLLRATGTASSIIRYNISEVSRVNVSIYDAGSTLVRTLVDATQTAGAKVTAWNGRVSAAPNATITAEGWYTYEINATSTSGSDMQQGTIYIDTSKPAISNLTATAEIPDTSTACSVSYDLSEDSSVTIGIYNSSNALVKMIASRAAQSAGTNTVSWDGTDRFNNYVVDGAYTYRISAVDAAHWISAPVSGIVTVDRETPAITLRDISPDPFKPTGRSTMTIRYKLTETSRLKIQILDGAATIKTVFDATRTAGSHSVTWNGKDGTVPGALVPDKQYAIQLNATDTAGNVAPTTTGSVTIDTTKPTITLDSLAPDPFQPGGGALLGVSYTPSENAYVTVAICSNSGSLVRPLISNVFTPPSGGTAYWNGRGRTNVYVSAGTYKCKITAIDEAGNRQDYTSSFVVN
ncbi:MAG: FlgD immunoglobulin-like domain containing protein [Actinomycetota bacterium]|nr:FlgD immunoglobulin-like domain containing protein [Actinomycetota bacterium]